MTTLTVNELILILKALPPEMPVLRSGCGCDSRPRELSGLDIRKVVEERGQYRHARESDPDQHKAFVI